MKNNKTVSKVILILFSLFTSPNILSSESFTKSKVKAIFDDEKRLINISYAVEVTGLSVAFISMRMCEKLITLGEIFNCENTKEFGEDLFLGGAIIGAFSIAISKKLRKKSKRIRLSKLKNKTQTKNIKNQTLKI